MWLRWFCFMYAAWMNTSGNWWLVLLISYASLYFCCCHPRLSLYLLWFRNTSPFSTPFTRLLKIKYTCTSMQFSELRYCNMLPWPTHSSPPPPTIRGLWLVLLLLKASFAIKFNYNLRLSTYSVQQTITTSNVALVFCYQLWAAACSSERGPREKQHQACMHVHLGLRPATTTATHRHPHRPTTTTWGDSSSCCGGADPHCFTTVEGLQLFSVDNTQPTLTENWYFEFNYFAFV